MSIRVLIIEDEHSAAENLKYLLKKTDPFIVVEKTIETVTDAVAFFTVSPNIDLVFMDIHLADGISFQIFEAIPVNIPIIFTTAYDEYTLEAFKVNSVDYLLKPIDEEELKRAVEKYKSTRLQPFSTELYHILQAIGKEKKSYKSTYLVQQRDTLYPLKVADVAYFTIDNGIVKAISKDNESYVINKKLEEIELELDPKQFFRTNRQYIVHRNAVENFKLYFNGKLILNIRPKPNEQIIVSKAKASIIKEWMDV